MWPDERTEPLPMGSRHHDRAAQHVVAPAFQYWYHAVPLSRLQVRRRSSSKRAGRAQAWISARIGGDQIDYADESAGVRTRFPDALAENDLAPDMDQFYEAEIPDLPPSPRRSPVKVDG